MNHWLFKSEPHVFSIDDLKRKKIAIWDGVRNYQARNYLRTALPGNRVFFYHSSSDLIGIAGICEVVEANIADPTQFDPKSDYFDPKSTKAEPRWQTVKVKFVEKFAHVIPLDTLKATFSGDEFALVRKGMRLSVMPVNADVASRILTMAH